MIKQNIEKINNRINNIKYNNLEKRNIQRKAINIFFVLIVALVIFIYKFDDKQEKYESGVSLLADEEIIKKESAPKADYEKYLKEYAYYYNLDPDKVINFAIEITEDFSIDLSEFLTRKYASNIEGKSMLFVYYLSRDKLINPLSDYGLAKSYFAVNSKRRTMNKDLVLDSGLTFSQFLGKVSDNLNMNKYYLLAISYLETGRVTSSLALNKNNFGGLRGSGEYYTYPSPEVGIIAFCINLKGYEKYNLTNIYDLSGIYTHGNKNNPSYTWVNSVRKYYSDISSNPSKYFILSD